MCPPKNLNVTKVAPIFSSCGSLNKLPGLTGADKINLLNGRFSVDAPPAEQQLSPVSLKVEKDGSVEIPGKGWRFVFVARYSYDPFQHSPNESPEAELQVNAGDELKHRVLRQCDQMAILFFQNLAIQSNENSP